MSALPGSAQIEKNRLAKSSSVGSIVMERDPFVLVWN